MTSQAIPPTAPVRWRRRSLLATLGSHRGNACLTTLVHNVRRRRGEQRAARAPVVNLPPLDLFARLGAGRISWRIYA
jgi:hypothetical protein